MADLGKTLIILGGILVLAGGVIYALSKAGISLGALPGDIQFRRGNLTCIVPIVSSIVLSIVLTLILNLVIRLINR